MNKYSNAQLTHLTYALLEEIGQTKQAAFGNIVRSLSKSVGNQIKSPSSVLNKGISKVRKNPGTAAASAGVGAGVGGLVSALIGGDEEEDTLSTDEKRRAIIENFTKYNPGNIFALPNRLRDFVNERNSTNEKAKDSINNFVNDPTAELITGSRQDGGSANGILGPGGRRKKAPFTSEQFDNIIREYFSKNRSTEPKKLGEGGYFDDSGRLRYR